MVTKIERRCKKRLINNAMDGNGKDNLKWTLKPSYMPQKVFDNDLVAMRESKVTLTLTKQAYVIVWILGLRKVLMYQFH